MVTFVLVFTFVLIALVMLVEIIFLMCPLFVSFLYTYKVTVGYYTKVPSRY